MHGQEENFQSPVSDFMVTRLETIAPGATMEQLMPILRADKVAIVADDETFFGLITKVDLINDMRRHMAEAV